MRRGKYRSTRGILNSKKDAGLAVVAMAITYGLLAVSHPQEALHAPLSTIGSTQVKGHHEVQAADSPTPSPTPTSAEITLSARGPLRSTGRLYLDGPVPVSTARYSPTPVTDPLEPIDPDPNAVQWVEGLGVSPSDAEQGTVFLIGHSWSAGSYALNPVSRFVTTRTDFSPGQGSRLVSSGIEGATLTLEDANRVSRRWRIHSSYLVPKDEAHSDSGLFDPHEPGRLVLITCAITADRDLHYNVVLIGQLIQP
ncbi:class F sortase [Corynebacterium pyruviciproducens]|nr:class F sortase [Corynebacterium pyruviciproducens]MDK6565286.1 class F sortase [Corynebacterium pyruviciproducens]